MTTQKGAQGSEFNLSMAVSCHHSQVFSLYVGDSACSLFFTESSMRQIDYSEGFCFSRR